MKHKKELMLLIVLTIFLSIVYSFSYIIPLVYAQDDWCYFPTLADKPCTQILSNTEIASEADCKAHSGEISYEGECTTGCCCIWKPVDKKYEQQTGTTKGYCNSLPSSVFNPSVSSPALCTNYCNSLTALSGDEGKLPACMNGIDDDNNGLIDYPDEVGCSAPEDDSEEATASEKECSDQIDNDGDGKIDYYGFYESSYQAQDNTKYADYKTFLTNGKTPDPCCTKSFGMSESCSFDECSVGENTKDQGTYKGLCQCGKDVCGFPEFINPLFEQKTYATGKYCCAGKCSKVPCGPCTEGETIYVIDNSGKTTYNCTNGVFVKGLTEPIGAPEQCFGAENDDDNNGATNCEDTKCYTLKCSMDKGATKDGATGKVIIPYGCGKTSSLTVSYFDESDDYWKCCFPINGQSRVNDCKYNDGVPDTCGACECLNLHKPAQNLKVQHVYGQAKLNLSFYFECQEPEVKLKVLRCDGTAGSCDVNNDGTITLETSTKFVYVSDNMDCLLEQLDNNENPTKTDCFGDNGILQPGAKPEKIYAIFDTKIMSEKDYTYVLESIYPDKEISFSNAFTMKSGSKMCLSHSGHFCIRNNPDFLGSETKKYSCDENNKLQVESCEGSSGEWPEEVCMETKDTNGVIATTCALNTPCIFCGNPFNMYGSLGSNNILSVPEEYYGYKSSTVEEECYLNSVCYYDATNTIKDAYDSCKNIGSCSNYKSQLACNVLNADTGSNNKCLPYDCQWVAFDTFTSELELGICTDDTTNYKTCDMCNKLTSKLFGGCNADSCKTNFNSETTLCYFDKVKKSCVESSKITCSNYDTEKDCHASYSTPNYDSAHSVDVNVTYDKSGKRIWGDNSIIEPSHDLLDFKICKWKDDTDACIRDANGDGKYDVAGEKAIDITPPQTEVIAPSNVGQIELKFAINDPTPEGRPSSGELKTYYCFPDNTPLPKEIITQYKEDPAFKEGVTEEEVNYCYPDTLFVPDAGAASKILSMESGQQTMFFYSEDGAHNIEPIKYFTFNIDNKPPVITITPYLTLDQYYPFEQSSVLLSVELDEKAICYDIFEDYEGIKKINYESGSSFQAVYDNLGDGTYFYTVVCEDKLGNKINKTTSVKIDADQEIQGSLPEGVIDYSPVNLEIKTTHKSPNDDCRIGTGDTFDVLSGFASKTQADIFTKYSTPFSLIDNKVYEFKVMCKFSGKLHKDEIQFVYDTTPPKTSLTDSAGNTFDISKWYNKQEASQSVYLKCNDEPEYGFGCEETKYCIETGSAKCDINFDTSSGTSVGASYESYSAVKISPAPQPQWLCFQSKEDTYPPDLSSYGGSIEEKQCVKLLIDSNSGPTIDVPLLKPHTEMINAYEYFTPLFTINGEVVDSDAEANPPPQNKLTIDVYPITEDYLKSLAKQIDSQQTGQAQTPPELKSTQTFTIDANNQFSQELTLSSGLNKIVLGATDRSGKTSETYEYYIMVSNFDGNLFEVISPPKGVSETKEFDLIIETTKDLPAAESCALSTNPKVGFTSQMQKIEGKKFKNHINFPGMKEETYYTVYVKCTFPGGVFDIKEIDLIWDTTPPSIENSFIQPSDGKSPPSIIEPPLETNLTIITNDKSRCKFSEKENSTYFTMSLFKDYETQNLSYVNEHPLTNLQDKKNYTYYVKCDNGPTEPASMHISNEAKITFSVDTSQFTGMEMVKPTQFIGYTSVNFELHTTKKSTECTFGPTQELIDQYYMKTVTEGVDAYKVHTGGPLTLIEGEHDFYFECLTAAEGPISDDFVFTVDLSPPIVQVKTQPYTSSLNTLTANWEAYDNNTQIKGYNYSIGTKQGIADIFDWSVTDNEKKTIHNLNLNNETTYWWNVKAINSVGLVSTIASNSTYVDTTYDPGFEVNISNIDVCKDDVLDSDETDIDCGGSCQKCSNGKNCDTGADCIGGKCESGICISASCEDNILNQLETDIDCGGSCASCPEGMNCNINSDCSTGFCKSGFCTLPSCDDNVQNGQEQGIDCGGSCLNVCEIIPSPDEEETCDDEIKNQDETGIDCGGSCKACEIPPEKTEPTDEPSTWWIWLIMLLIIAGIGGGGYYYYTAYFFKEKYPKTQQRMQSRPLSPFSQPQQQSSVQTKMQQSKPISIRQTFNRFFKPLPKEFREKRSQEKLKQRNKIFGAFESADEQKEKLETKQNLADARTNQVKEEPKILQRSSIQTQTPTQPKIQISEVFKPETGVAKEEIKLKQTELKEIKETKIQQKQETKKQPEQKEQTPKLKAKEFLKPKKKAVKQLTASSSAIDKLSKLKKESAMSKLGKGKDAFKQLSTISKKR